MAATPSPGAESMGFKVFAYGSDADGSDAGGQAAGQPPLFSINEQDQYPPSGTTSNSATSSPGGSLSRGERARGKRVPLRPRRGKRRLIDGLRTSHQRTESLELTGSSPEMYASEYKDGDEEEFDKGEDMDGWGDSRHVEKGERDESLLPSSRSRGSLGRRKSTRNKWMCRGLIAVAGLFGLLLFVFPTAISPLRGTDGSSGSTMSSLFAGIPWKLGQSNVTVPVPDPAKVAYEPFKLPGGYVRPARLETLARKTTVLLKTGTSVIFDRLPVQIMQTENLPLPMFPVRHYYSDADMKIGEVEVKDIFLNLSKGVRSKASFNSYRILHKTLAAGMPVPKGGEQWDLDMYKIMPMHGDAYRKHPDFLWQLGIDGDTFLFIENMLRYLDSKDSGVLQYLGHIDSRDSNVVTASKYGEGKLFWAHGGSGYALSKFMLDRMLKANPWRFNDGSIDREMTEEGAGDVLLGRIVTDDTNGTFLGPNAGEGLFNPDQVRSLNFNNETWFLPVLSLHHLSNAEVYGLRQFEHRMLNALARKHGEEGDYIRRCDVAMHMLGAEVQAALEAFDRDPMAEQTVLLDHTRFTNTRPVSFGPPWAELLKVSYDEFLCPILCEERKTCFGWHFEKEKGCILSLDEWNLPLPAPSESTRAGIRVDRLHSFFRENDCSNMEARKSRDDIWK